MKKLLVALIVTLTLSGSIFAQQPESHWPGFDYHAFEMQGALYASIMINGEPVDVNYENWDQMEVAAFVGDELRMTGMYLTDEYVLEYNELFPTLNGEPIYYDNPGEVVSFKMYNHATGDEYGQCQILIYEGDEVVILTGEEHWEGLDDIEHPLMLNFTIPEPTQTITLAEGWNWVSFNKEITLNDLKAALLETAPAGTGIMIKSKDKTTEYKPATGRWSGRLTALDLSQMYLIQVAGDCAISLQGLLVDPADHPVTVLGGGQYTYIAFPLEESMSLANAFAGFAVQNDKVKAKSSNAEYLRRWQGQLTTLEPGAGYMYMSAPTAADRNFVFPSGTSKAASAPTTVHQRLKDLSSVKLPNTGFELNISK